MGYACRLYATQKGVLVSNLHVHLWLEIESKTETNNVLADDTEITLQLNRLLTQKCDVDWLESLIWSWPGCHHL